MKIHPLRIDDSCQLRRETLSLFSKDSAQGLLPRIYCLCSARILPAKGMEATLLTRSSFYNALIVWLNTCCASTWKPCSHSKCSTIRGAAHFVTVVVAHNLRRRRRCHTAYNSNRIVVTFVLWLLRRHLQIHLFKNQTTAQKTA